MSFSVFNAKSWVADTQRRNLKTLFCVTVFCFATALVSQPAHAATVVVTPSNSGNWAFDNRDANGIVGANPGATGEFVNGPGTPPLGTGSAHLATGNGTTGGDGSAELRNTGYSGVLLSSITALSYSTYMTQNNGQQFPYFGLMISTTGGSVSNDTLFFEPPYQTPGAGNPSLPNQGPTALNQWQTWDAFSGGWWDNNGNANPGSGPNGVDSLASFLALFPNATIVNAGGLGGVRFNVGFASANNQFDGYLDAFTIGINGQNTTYNFELAAVSAVPEPSTWAMMLIGFGCLGFFGYRRSRLVVPA